jgi:hypothetical protein
MGRLIPEGFLTLREASQRIATAIFSGQPDRPNVTRVRELGFDARDEAIEKIWTAVDSGKLQAFVVGPHCNGGPKRLTSAISKGIPLLRSTKGGDLRFFRPSNEAYDEFARWFGPDVSHLSRGEDRPTSAIGAPISAEKTSRESWRKTWPSVSAS